MALAEKFGEHVYPPQSSDMNLIFKAHLKMVHAKLSFSAQNFPLHAMKAHGGVERYNPTHS